MALEELEAQIGVLVEQMENLPEGAHEIHLLIHEKLQEMKAFGLPLPDDLVRLERRLEEDFRIDQNEPPQK